jgi:hypothetical protein
VHIASATAVMEPTPHYSGTAVAIGSTVFLILLILAVIAARGGPRGGNRRSRRSRKPGR